jgi:flagellar motility protein MotE (MotC chaperone)
VAQRFDIRALDAYAWVFDLVADDAEAREAAVRRHLTLLWRRSESRPTGTLADPAGAFTEERTGLTGEELRRLEPYALLWLQWQERFRADWLRVKPRWPWTPSPIYGFIRHGASPAARAALEDLLLEAVSRPRRALGDGQFHALARHLDSPSVRERLREAASRPDRAARLHAAYVLWRVEHPREPMTDRSWRRWRRTHGVPITHPRTAPELAALPPAEAAAELGGLGTQELAEVFEALEPAPAARIAAAMGDDAAVPAIAAMEVRSAAWMLNSMPQPLAARLLAAMPPALAAMRFTRPKRDQVLLLMSAGAAAERLCAMSPLRASQHLQWRPVEVAAGFLAAMDPAAAAPALAAMSGGWGPARVLAALPEDVSAGLLARMPPQDRDRVRWTAETERFAAAHRAAVTAADPPGPQVAG